MSTSSTIQAVQGTVAPAENSSGVDSSLSGWIFERVKDFVAERVLEIANWEGIVAPVCKQHGIEVEVMDIDLADEEFEEKYEELMGKYDTLIVLNAGEQIKKDKHIVLNCVQLLKQGGHLITRLPAQTALFNGLDQGFSHWKYYNVEYINNLLRKNCRILKTRYFLLDHAPPSPNRYVTRYSERVTVFNGLIPTGMTIGLSMIVVGQKR